METTLYPMDNVLMPRHEFLRLVGTSIGAILLTRCMAGCAGQGNGDPTPDPSQKINFTLRLDDKVNENLLTKGGYVITNDIIVAQTKAGQFVAVSANCTHQGTELVYKSVENQFYCPLHLSRFDTTGKVIIGPATKPLTQYSVEVNLVAGTVRVYS
ncbi:QcrA and Rieske domain-containing protein [Spirosoma flavum]|uniref:Ubiquinol-cytochrome c reductase iron-sulfur subunit n=1 Tax=Spirosoma flavum TaxID=2048557 RepID=A0ABW6AFX7_9BACT